MLAVFVAAAHASVFDRCVRCLQNAQSLWSDDRCPPGQSPLVGPHDLLPNGVQCCATRFGDRIAECETNSCAENFGGFEYTCSNYGVDGSDMWCPYSQLDRAICDVSFFVSQNGENCRQVSSGNCLGKVKCNTNGVVLADGKPSNGTATGGGGPCSSSSWGFAEGEDCFYNGGTEQWKVCSSHKRKLLASTRKPTSKPTTRRPTRVPSNRKPSKAAVTKKLTTDKPSKLPTPKKTSKPTNPKPTKKPHLPPSTRPTKATQRPTVPFGEPDPEGEKLNGWPWWWPFLLKAGAKNKPTTRKPSKARTARPTRTTRPTRPRPTRPTKTPSVIGTSLLPTTTVAPTPPTATPTTASPTTLAPGVTPTTSLPTSLPTIPTTVAPTPPTATPTTASPITVAPGVTPTTSLPTSLPTTPTTVAPTTSFPTTPTTASPIALAPGTFSPTRIPTGSAKTLSPTSASPTESPTSPVVGSASPTLKPTTASPTASPITASPTTSNPTHRPTANPTTVNPTTVNPTTINPTTVNPTTINPTTVNPTTINPTTISPTTVNPTTINPTTVNPTTISPTTINPTTINPTTISPTTINPTTINPTTVNPTASPTVNPTASPTVNPTASPTFNPTTVNPTASPSVSPTASPTLPTASPTTASPTAVPTICSPQVLFNGGIDETLQGWSTTDQAPPSSITANSIGGFTTIQTSTPPGAPTSGFLLLTKAVVPATRPFAIRVYMRVNSVSLHTPLNAGVAIMTSVGTPTDTAQMIFLESGAIGFGDDSQVAAFAGNGFYHSYDIAVDTNNVMTVKADGVLKLTRNNFISNGNFAIGDQSSAPNVDGDMDIASITLLCPP